MGPAVPDIRAGAGPAGTTTPASTPTGAPTTPVAPATGTDDDAEATPEEDEEQRPETDIADIAPGEHSVTDDGAGATDAKDDDKA